MSSRASIEVSTGTEPVRVAAYTRISTDEERQPNSLEAQRVRLDASRRLLGTRPRVDNGYMGETCRRANQALMAAPAVTVG